MTGIRILATLWLAVFPVAVEGFKKYQLQHPGNVNDPWQNIGQPTEFGSATNVITDKLQLFRVVGFSE